MWPEVVQTKPSKETKAKAHLVKEVFAGATAIKDTLPHDTYPAWVARYTQNCKKGKKYRLPGPLTTRETDKQVKFCVGRAQNSRLDTDTFYEE